MSEANAREFPWKKVLAKAAIDLTSWDRVSPKIPRAIFSELKVPPKDYIPIYSQKERDRKLGLVPDIWPFRTGIGECVLIRGDMTVKNVPSEHEIIELQENQNVVSNSLRQAKTERECIVQGYNSGVFQRLLIINTDISSKPLYLGSAGKLYVTADAQYFQTIPLSNVQFELDWSVESPSEILHFEAKFSTSKPTSEFILFQVFYPTVYFQQKSSQKPIRAFFLDILKPKNANYADYHFLEIAYQDPYDLASYNTQPITNKTIRVIY